MAINESKLFPSQRLRVAYLLALVGGYLDAYTYFLRGGVFANAQTGNIVKLGIALADNGGVPEHWVHYLLPILAYTAGLFAAIIIEELLARKGSRLIRRTVLVVEMVGLAVVGFIPFSEDGNMLANCIISFVAAMQFEAFKSFRGQAIATTMSTGNLRKFAESIFAAVLHDDAEQYASASIFASVIVAFTCGAFLGAKVCMDLGAAAVAPAITLLGAAVVVITSLHRRNRAT